MIEKECWFKNTGETEEECRKRQEELLKKHKKIRKHLKEFRRQHEEFKRYHKYLRYCRPAIVIFYLLFVYFLFWWVGFKVVGIFFAIFIGLKEIGQVLFMLRLEKRVFTPIEKLKNGVEEISQGNYDVRVECEVTNEIGVLIDSFNEMARKLLNGERMKAEYEENRKMLIANISHDIKTPITSIQGYIEVILDGNAVSRDNLDKYLQTIYRNTVYINKLIDDLFLFSKLDLQKLDFQYEKVHIQAFMDDLMEEFKFELDEKQIRFTYKNRIEKDCIVNIDRKRINQAIRNIIGNAVKYGPEKDLSIRVEMYKYGGRIAIDINDNGPGIPEAKLQYVFNRFYRIDSERTKDLMSTGLGLAIAKELVEAHGGEISVSSKGTGGTCFIILLPFIEEQA